MILSFYSYKGGVGRTSLALDTAARVALGSATREPLRVLVWDLDLDAPGIAHFPALANMARRASRGTRDLLALLEADAADGAEVGESEVLAVLQEAIVSDPKIADGRLSLLLPGGAQVSTSAAGAPDVARLFGPGASGPSLLVLAAELARRELGFDVIVVDARTGVNDLSATATTVLADCGVLVFRLDGQDLAHIADIVNAILDAWGRTGASGLDLPNRLYRVANLVPIGRDAELSTGESSQAGERERLELLEALALRRKELADLRLEPHIQLALRPLALLRESSPRLDRTPLDEDTEAALERLADWVYERWADLSRRNGSPAGKPGRSAQVSTLGKRLEDEVAALLRLGGWRVSSRGGEGERLTDLTAEKVGEFGRQQSLHVSCDATRTGPSAADVERLGALRAGLAENTYSEVMLVARRIPQGAASAARAGNVLAVTPETLLDEQAPGAPLRRRARELWEGTAVERYYVSPTAVVLDGGGSPTGERSSLDEYALKWLDETATGLLCVLGDFGAGKTTFCQRLAAVLAGRSAAPLPLFVDLRTAGSTALTVDGLLRHALDQAKLDQSRLDPWKFRLQQGSLVLLVDGFDELLGYTDPLRMEGLLEELKQAASSGRVVLTSRSSYFRSDRDAMLALSRQRSARPRARAALWNQLQGRGEVAVTALEVQPFTDEQVHAYLSRRFGTERLSDILARLRRLHPVDDLLRRPYLLALVATSIDQWEVRGWPTRLTLTSVYESYVSDWLTRDERKHQGLPAAPASFAQHLARVLWDRPEAHMPTRELRREAAAWGAGASGRMISPEEEETIEAKVRTALFLVRDERGAYRFAHRSFMEFFVAKDIAGMLAGSPTREQAQATLDLPRLTPEITAFLAGWPDSWSALPDVCRDVLASAPTHPRASANALLLTIWHARAQPSGEGEPRLTPVAIEGAQLAGVDLSRADLTAVSLRRADLAGAHLAGATLTDAYLSEASLVDVDAARANLTRTDLSHAHLQRAMLAKACLDGADLEHADLSGCDLRRASLRGATLADCRLVYALLSHADLTEADATGAELSHACLLGAVLDEVDLCSAALEHVDLRFASLRGTIVPEGIAEANTYGARRSPTREQIEGAAVGHLSIPEPQALCWVGDAEGDSVAVGCADGSVRSWSPRSGRFRLEHSRHTAPVRALCTLTDETGSWVLSAGEDGLLVGWRAAGEQRAVSHRGSEEPIVALCALDRLATPLVAFGDGSRIHVWDPREPESSRVLFDQEATVTALCAVTLPGGGHGVASAGDDLTIRVWDVGDRRPRGELAAHTKPIRALCEVTLADGNPGLASAGDDERIRLWDLESRSCASELRGHTDWIRTLCAVRLTDGSPGLASAGDDQVVRLWRVGEDEQIATLTGHSQWVRAVAVADSPDGGAWVASTGEDETIRVWDVASGEMLTAVHGQTSKTLGLSPAALRPGVVGVAVANADTGLRLWSLERGELADVLVGAADQILAVCPFTLPDASLGVAVGGHQTIRIWNTAALSPSIVIAHHCEWLNALAQVVPREGPALIAAAGDDGVIRVFEPQRGELVRELGGGEDEISALAQVKTRQGESVLASADAGGNVIAYEIDRDGLARRFGCHDAEVTALCPFTDERGGLLTLASAGSDGEIVVWSLDDGAQIARFLHPGGVSAICSVRPRPDSPLALASVGGDGAIRLWWPGREEPCETIRARPGAALALTTVSLGGADALVSAGVDGAVCVHHLDREGWLTLVAVEASSHWMAYSAGGRLCAEEPVAWGTEQALNRVLLVGDRWNAADVRSSFPAALHEQGTPELLVVRDPPGQAGAKRCR